MRRTALIPFLAGFFALSLYAAPMPSVIKAAAAANEAGKFASKHDFPLDSTGLAFFHDQLFVGCNIGLLEFDHGALACLYQWNKKDGVAEGPWRDDANGLLWLWLPGGDLLANYDGAKWQNIAVPEPKKGTVTRGDALAGYRGASNGKDFWLEGARHAWTWNPRLSQWKEEENPPVADEKNDPFQSLTMLIPVVGRPYFVMRHEPSWSITETYNYGKPLRGDSVCFRKDDGSWQDVENQTGGIFFVEQTLALNDRGYIRTNHGSLLEVAHEQVTKVETPGAS
jgi:hypothetical protein